MRKRGISVLMLAVTIVIMAILVTSTLVGVNLAINDARLRTLAQDMVTIEDKIQEQYSLTGTMPITGPALIADQVLTKITPSERALLLAACTADQNNESNYYEISLADLGITTSNRGTKKTQDDIYVISENSMRVYYLKGVKIGDTR